MISHEQIVHTDTNTHARQINSNDLIYTAIVLSHRSIQSFNSAYVAHTNTQTHTFYWKTLQLQNYLVSAVQCSSSFLFSLQNLIVFKCWLTDFNAAIDGGHTQTTVNVIGF